MKEEHVDIRGVILGDGIMWIKKFSPRSYCVHLFKLEKGTKKKIPRWGKPEDNLQPYSTFIYVVRNPSKKDSPFLHSLHS